MARNKSNNAPLDDWKGFYDELQKETPRAAIIIAAAFIDGWLRRLLENMMVDDPNVVEALLGRDESADDRPLSTFAARIKATYCLGLVSKHEYDDLNLLRKIRNRFAHRPHGFSFDEQEIVSWCSSLKIPKEIVSALPQFPRDRRSLFQLGVSLLAIKLSLRVIAVKRKRKTSPNEFGTVRLVSLISS